MSETFRDDTTEHDARLAAVYRAAAREEPPPALDDAIRAAARRAVSTRPRRVSSPFIRSWRVPLSIAAVMLLTVSLVTVMREEPPEIMLPPGGVRLVDEADHMRAGPAADVPNAPALAKRAMPEPFPGGVGMRDDKVGAPAEMRRQSAKGEASPTPARAAEAVSSASVPAMVPAPVAGAGAERKPQARSEPVSADAAVREASQARVKAAPAAPLSASPAASQMAGVIQPRADLPPDKWLERIDELRRQGKFEDAKTSLAEFRKRYPDYELPASLKDWAKP